MTISTNDAKLLGYAGSGVVDGIQVLVTSGTIDIQRSPAFLTPLDLPPIGITGAAQRSKIVHADGTAVSNCSISFDVTDESLALFSTTKLLRRGYQFTVALFDGNTSQQLLNCIATQVGLSGAAGGLIAATVSAMSALEPTEEGDAIVHNFIRDEVPYGYWRSGNIGVRDWSFGFSQAVTPVFCNKLAVWPQYMKVGPIEATLDCTTFEQLQEHDEIEVATSNLRLVGKTGSSGYSFNGPSDLATYRHSFVTGADALDGSDSLVLYVS